MYYEINVSLNGLHFFATAPRSCVTEHQCKNVLKELLRRFPESEGWKVTVTRYETLGTRLNLE